MHKIFRVTAEFEYFVSAENEDVAQELAQRHFDEAARNEFGPDLFVSEVSDPKKVPQAWRESYAYGDGPDVVIAQYFPSK